MLRLNEYTIYVVGVGGTGSQLCQLLSKYISFSHFNPRRVILADDDIIEDRNAERQDFDRLEAGKPKVEVIKRKFIATSGFGYVEALPVKLDVDSLPLDIGVMSEQQAKILVFVCVDSARARNAIWSELVGVFDAKERKYVNEGPKYKGDFIVIDGGNTEYTGQVTTCIKTTIDDTVVLLGQDPRILFENVRNADPSVTSCQERQQTEPQTVMANQQVATLMFNEFVSLFKQLKFQPLTKFDLTTRQMQPVGQLIDLVEVRQQILEQKLAEKKEETTEEKEINPPSDSPTLVDPEKLMKSYLENISKEYVNRTQSKGLLAHHIAEKKEEEKINPPSSSPALVPDLPNPTTEVQLASPTELLNKYYNDLTLDSTEREALRTKLNAVAPF